MKILCFTDGFMQGGAERQLVGLANLLQKKGYDVILASYHKYNFYKPLIDSCNLRYYYIDGGDKQITKLYACFKYFKKEKFDWIISYKGGSNQICCILKALGLKYRLIVSERCLVYNFNSYQKKKFFLYRFANIIVPNSNAQEKFIKQHYPQYSLKIKTITNFTDTNHFIPSNINEHEGRFKILVTARLSKQKNIERFIQTVKKVYEMDKTIRVDWYGNINYSEEDYAEYCKKLVEKLNISNVFYFHDATNNILEEYQQCDVFCLPSIFEGFPNVVCEAMSCGKPILCSNVCDNSSIIEDGVNGYLFDPESIDDMASKILKMSHLSKETIINMGEASRKIAESKFSEEVFVNKYINIVES